MGIPKRNCDAWLEIDGETGYCNRKLGHKSVHGFSVIPRAIIVAGNLSDGFTFIGPYEDWEEAAMESERMNIDSWIATLEGGK